MTGDEFKELCERLDGRYVLKKDCEEDMDEVEGRLNAHDVKVALYDHDFKILKWLGATTLGAVLLELITRLFEVLP